MKPNSRPLANSLDLEAILRELAMKQKAIEANTTDVNNNAPNSAPTSTVNSTSKNIAYDPERPGLKIDESIYAPESFKTAIPKSPSIGEETTMEESTVADIHKAD